MSADRGAVIGVVGASARAASFTLLRAGNQVVAADLYADADLARVCRVSRVTPYPEGLIAWLEQTACRRWLYTGALENYPQLVDRLARIRPLIGAQGKGLVRVRDPLLLQEVLNRSGFHFPTTRDARQAHSGTERWLGKSYHGSSGSEVGHTAGKRYVQRYVEGTPLSAVFYGQKLCGVTRQLVGEAWTGAARYQYCGSIGPWPLRSGSQETLRRLGALLCQEFGLVGWYGVDLIAAGERLWTIEVNPRYTAAVEIVERAAQDRSACFGKAILFCKQPITVSAQLSAGLLGQCGEISWPRLADIPPARTQLRTGQPILTAFAVAPNPDAVEIELRQRVAELERGFEAVRATARVER
ncbi:MAG: ATP-grasp domain-containing protein [Pirellulales bacterium]|nr:ATP-grasp domain-containing protein [Pirellulales bacterium]